MGLDADIILATVRQFEECVFIYERRFDKLGMNNRYFDFLLLLYYFSADLSRKIVNFWFQLQCFFGLHVITLGNYCLIMGKNKKKER